MRFAFRSALALLLALTCASPVSGQIIWQPAGGRGGPGITMTVTTRPATGQPASRPAASQPAGLTGISIPGLPLFQIGEPATQPAPLSPRDFDEAVSKAIEKAVDAIWNKRQDDGSWNSFEYNTRTYPMGLTALAAYALLESGVSPQDRRMTATLQWLAKHDDGMTYCHALRAQVWLLANPQTGQKYRRELELNVKRLILSAGDGAYTYKALGDGKGLPVEEVKEYPNGFNKPAVNEKYVIFDNSNSQFGVLGVWAGARAGMDFIPPGYWLNVIKHWVPIQHRDGGWDYHGGELEVWPSMTAAGLATLFVCIDNLTTPDPVGKCQPPQGAQYRAVEMGLDWVEKNFEASLQPNYGTPEIWNRYFTYYLYSIERVAFASGYKYFGKADWYKAGCRWLLRRQKADGTWGGLVDDCFALLFLSRGRNPVLFNHLQYSGDWNNRFRALAGLTDYISRNFERMVHWQMVNSKSAVNEWHDAPILFISGSKAPAFTDEELSKLRAFVQQGGTILSVQECGDYTFGSAMRKVYAKLFPDYELVAAPKDHDIYSIQFPLRGRPQFFILSNGVRPLAIHVENDLTLQWQLKTEKTEAWAFEAAANAFFYVTDSTLRPRGALAWPEPPAEPPKRTVKLARVKYPGNWDPEPLAYERLGLLLAGDSSIRLDVSATSILDLPASGAPIATITGTTELHLAADEQAAIKRYVESGGLLVLDAAGGSKLFATSAKDALYEIFGPGTVKKLAADAALYAAGDLKEFKYRRKTRDRLPNPKAPYAQGIMFGDRLGVLFSAEDITGGLVGCQSHACDGYAPQTAYDIMRCAILLAAPAPAPTTGPSTAPATAPATQPQTQSAPASTPDSAPVSSPASTPASSASFSPPS